jgi:large subunit ribosomal protein L31
MPLRRQASHFGIFGGTKAFLSSRRRWGFGTLCALTTKEEISLKQIHPELTLTSVRCTTCGTTFTTRSTRSELVVDVCSNCHPAYTGRERTVSSGSRVERFERRRQKARNR